MSVSTMSAQGVLSLLVSEMALRQLSMNARWPMLLQVSMAALMLERACASACVVVSSDSARCVPQSGGQLVAVSPGSHWLLPQQGIIAVCLHCPCAQVSVVQKLRSSQPPGQVSCVFLACSSGACTRMSVGVVSRVRSWRGMRCVLRLSR